MKQSADGYVTCETAEDVKETAPHRYDTAIFLIKRGFSDNEIAKRLGLYAFEIKLVREAETER